MSYLRLETVKNHLNLDPNFDLDDMYLFGLMDAAEEIVALTMDEDLTNIEDENGDLPASVKHAMLLLIGTWYANRESVAATNMMPIPHAYEMLTALWHNYKHIK